MDNKRYLLLTDYIEKYSFGLKYSNSIVEYVKQDGSLPFYYINTTSFLLNKNIKEINLFHLVDVMNINTDIVIESVRLAYKNLWKLLDNEINEDDLTDEELLGIATVALGINEFVKYHGNSSYEIFKNERVYFENWMIYKYDLKNGKNKILDKFILIREKLSGFKVKSYHFMSILGISNIEIPKLN